MMKKMIAKNLLSIALVALLMPMPNVLTLSFRNQCDAEKYSCNGGRWPEPSVPVSAEQKARCEKEHQQCMEDLEDQKHPMPPLPPTDDDIPQPPIVDDDILQPPIVPILPPSRPTAPNGKEHLLIEELCDIHQSHTRRGRPRRTRIHRQRGQQQRIRQQRQRQMKSPPSFKLRKGGGAIYAG